MVGQMQVNETLSDGLKRGFTVIIPAATVEAKRGQKLATIAKSMNLPGFRPGKVPANLVRQRYGAAVMTEVHQDSVEDAVKTLLQDRGLRSATQPQVELVHAEEGKDLEFKVEVELLPEITVPDFGAISLTRLKVEPDTTAVDKALGEIALRQRNLEDVTETRGAEKGEVLQVDFVGRIDGTAFDGGAGQNIDLEVGGSGFIPGFTEGLEGMKAGETRTVSVSFPDDYQAKELAGKQADFEIVAHTLKKPVPAPIDDVLAKAMGFEAIDQLREAIQQQMQREYDGLARMKVKRQLLDVLAEQARFAPPESMVNNEFDAIWRRIEADRKSGKLDDEDKTKDDDTLRTEYRAIAERRVRLGLLLAEIGRVNAIQVSQDEMGRAMRAEAARYRGQEREVIEFFRKNPQAAETLRGPILEEKVVDFILDQAKIAEKPATPEELQAEDESREAA